MYDVRRYEYVLACVRVAVLHTAPAPDSRQGLTGRRGGAGVVFVSREPRVIVRLQTAEGLVDEEQVLHAWDAFIHIFFLTCDPDIRHNRTSCALFHRRLLDDDAVRK